MNIHMPGHLSSLSSSALLAFFSMSLLLCACQWTETSGGTAGQTDPAEGTLVFTAVPPLEPEEFFGNAWDIFAEGVVDAGSAERLEALILENQIPDRSTLFISARGGDINAALDLGRAIREAGLFTYVGRQSQDEEGGYTWGTCTDAGVLAYLGGTFRWMLDGSEVCFTKAMTGMEEDSPTEDLIADYLVEMEVDERLLAHIRQARGREICLTEPVQADLQVTRTGDDQVKWSIEHIEVGPYLKGEITTWRGINKILMYCPGDGLRIHAIFDPEGRAGEVLNELNAHTLCLDDQYIPIPAEAIESRLEMNGWINIIFKVDDDWIEPLLQASHIGIMCQSSYDDPLFMGFSHMDFEGGARLLPVLLGTCTYKVGSVE